VTERSALEELYRETVLEHYRNPRNRTPLSKPDVQALVDNPVCGDQVRVEVCLKGERLERVAAISRGCSIAVASGSLMTEWVQGRARGEVAPMHAALRELVRGGVRAAGVPDSLAVLERVRDLPSRQRCALLAWEALEVALASGD